jgi:probable F420-dependent oxidoreductase
VSRPFRFGVVASEARSGDAWAAKARRAEALGYSTFLVPDPLGPLPAAIPAAAWAAAATSTLRVGTYVLANDFRNPVLLAREAATVDLLSGGRFELGLGAGRPNAGEDYQRLGIPFASGRERVDRLVESLAIVKALLAGERVDAPGPHYAMAGAEVFIRPAQRPRPPILVAAAGPRLLAVAAREADIVAIGAPPDETGDGLRERVERVRAAAGGRFDRLELNVNLLGVGAIPPYMARFGIDPQRLQRQGSPFLLTGAPDEMADQLRRLRDTLGISYVTMPEAFMDPFAPVLKLLVGR